MYTTRVEQHIRAPRTAVYQALIDAGAIARWRVPDGMTSTVHEYAPREGGSFRISLTYDAPGPAGKSSAHTDTFHGRFVLLPTTADSRGHATTGFARLWKQHLDELLRTAAKRAPG